MLSVVQTVLTLAAVFFVGNSAAGAARAVEIIEVPPSIEQGLDMIVVDAAAVPPEAQLGGGNLHGQDPSWSGAPLDFFAPANHLYTDLRRQLTRYRMSWSTLPQVRVPAAGAAMTVGSVDPRVSILRERLGLIRLGGFDELLKANLMEYQQAHGLAADGKAGSETLRSLNRGAAHYERLILLNMERARRLPAEGAVRKYILVDAGAARLWMYEDGKAVDSMRVIVGAPETQTPMMAARVRYLSLNPYWNVPPELARSLVAKKVLAEGLSYLKERDYEVLSDWSDAATPVDPSTVNWQAVADGKLEVRIRRGPGLWNSMGQMKFMLTDDLGIYLHDVPDKAQFAGENRWLSNGCVRLEDAQRLAKWALGRVPKPKTNRPEERVNLPQPIPVYLTYLTVEPAAKTLVFRPDRYDLDTALLARFPGDGDGMINAQELVLASGTGNQFKSAAPPHKVEGASVRKPAQGAGAKAAAPAKAAGAPPSKESAKTAAAGAEPIGKDKQNAASTKRTAMAVPKRQTVKSSATKGSSKVFSPSPASKSARANAQAGVTPKLGGPAIGRPSGGKSDSRSAVAKGGPEPGILKPKTQPTASTTAAEPLSPATKKGRTR